MATWTRQFPCRKERVWGVGARVVGSGWGKSLHQGPFRLEEMLKFISSMSELMPKSSHTPNRGHLGSACILQRWGAHYSPRQLLPSLVTRFPWECLPWTEFRAVPCSILDWSQLSSLI